MPLTGNWKSYVFNQVVKEEQYMAAEDGDPLKIVWIKSSNKLNDIYCWWK